MLHVWNIYLHMAYICGTYELDIGKYSSPMEYMGNNKWLFSNPSSISLSKPRTETSVCCSLVFNNVGGVALVDMMFDA